MEEDKSFLNYLKSNYIFDEIISYIEDENFKFKLLNYSKELKEKFSIKKIYYIKKYLDYCINENDKNILFLSSLHDCDCKKHSEYQKTIKEYAKKYSINKNAVEEYILNLIENRLKNEISDEININIFSPFLNLFIQKICQKLCFNINIHTINNHNLNDDIINIFKKMNESNINYKSLNIILDQDAKEENNFFKKIFSKNININNNFFNSLNINYDKIEKLTCSYLHPPKKNISTNFFNSLLSSFQNKNNLIYLNLTIGDICNNIDIINEFKSLKYLHLSGFHFTQNLVINLQNLEEISIINCKGIKIIFDEISKNVKFLKIVRSSIENNGKIVDLPNLEAIILDENLIELNNIINFSSFKKIEKYCGSYKYLKNMNLTFLKNLELMHIKLYYNEMKEFTSIFERIIALENLKEIKLNILYIFEENFNDIKGQNKYVNNLKIIFIDVFLENILNILLRMFPNITDIDIDATSYDNGGREEIRMDKNLTITKMNLNLDNLHFIKFNFVSFENLIELKLKFKKLYYPKSDINEFFNIFNCNKPIKFNSLKILSLIEKSYDFNSDEKDIEIFVNTINNNLCPNLEDLTLKCTRFYEKYYYNQLYAKILLFKLKKIDLKLINPHSDDTYSVKELKAMFPKSNFNIFEVILIERYDQKKIMEYKKYLKKINIYTI